MKSEELLIITGARGMLGKVLVDHFTITKKYLTVLSIDFMNTNRTLNENEKYFDLDITDEAKIREFYLTLYTKYSDVKKLYLINCAGISVFEDFDLRTKDSFMKVLEVNLYGTFNMIQNTARLARQLGAECSIVNTGSLFGSRSPDERNYVDLNRKNSEVYGASKAGVEQMTRYFSAHLAKFNTRVNCVSPGGILNEAQPQGEQFQKLYNYKVPMGRLAYYKEMIGAYEFLLSSTSANYITGQNIYIDGGYTSW
tara:strand:+ start:1906 stop:2667 length:762 start_codon:yes stop_codon:yes gene_type:complete